MLSTRNVKETTGSGKTPLKLQPGNNTVKIHKLHLKEGYNFQQTKAYQVIVDLESAPIEGDFQGFLVDQNNPSGPRYLGQVGSARLQYNSFEDGTTKNGYAKNRDNDILSAVVRLANALGVRQELDDTIDAAAISRIEELMPVATQVFRGKWLDVCLAGRGYKDKNGYTAYELFFPYPKEGKVPYEGKGTNSGNLMPFNSATHLIAPKEDKPVSGFEPNNSGMEFASQANLQPNNDFDLM